MQYFSTHHVEISLLAKLETLSAAIFRNVLINTHHWVFPFRTLFVWISREEALVFHQTKKYTSMIGKHTILPKCQNERVHPNL